MAKPPVGYVRDPKYYLVDHSHREVLPDGQRFDDVRSIWRKVLEGMLPKDVLVMANTQWGFTTRQYKSSGGGPLSKSEFYRMLRNPFYAGVMVRKGQSFAGRHRPMVTLEEFDKVQRILDARAYAKGRSKPALYFPYRGLISCGECGAQVTAKKTTNRHGKTYTYYHCCRKNYRHRYCSQGALQEKEIEAQLLSWLTNARPPKAWMSEATKHLKKMQASRSKAAERILRQREARAVEIETKLGRLRKLLLSDVLTADEYKVEKERLARAQAELRISQPAPTPAQLMKPALDGISLLSKAPELFQAASPTEKAVLFRQLVRNPKLKDKTLLIEGQFPFDWLSSWRSSPSLCAWRDLVETFLL